MLTVSKPRILNYPSVDFVFRMRHGLQGGCCQCLLHPHVRSPLCTAPQWWSSNVFAPFLARKCYGFVIEKSLFFWLSFDVRQPLCLWFSEVRLSLWSCPRPPPVIRSVITGYICPCPPGLEGFPCPAPSFMGFYQQLNVNRLCCSFSSSLQWRKVQVGFHAFSAAAAILQPQVYAMEMAFIEILPIIFVTTWWGLWRKL